MHGTYTSPPRPWATGTSGTVVPDEETPMAGAASDETEGAMTERVRVWWERRREGRRRRRRRRWKDFI